MLFCAGKSGEYGTITKDFYIERKVNMPNITISKRLAAIAAFVEQGADVADIGTDHGILPIYLCGQNMSRKAVAADLREGPLAAARTNIEKYGMEDQIELRMGSGVSVLKKEDPIDTIMIAGMGGPLIASILEEGKELINELPSQLILQPNVAAVEVRQWLLNNGWALTDECMIEEENHYYEILSAKKGDPEKPYRQIDISRGAALLFGPFLAEKKGTAFINQWKREKENWESISMQIDKAENKGHVQSKKQLLQQKQDWYREVFS